MATGSISMLGIGFGGQTALNADLIDQLKEADKAVMIKPMERKLTKVYAQQADQEKLESALDSFYDSLSIYSDDSSYLKRTAKSNSDAVSVSVDSGTAMQNFTLKVNQLATNSVQQSKGYAMEDSIVFTERVEDTFLEITLGGTKKTNIKISHGMTLSDLKDAINEASGDFTASILNVGGTDPYKLIIKSNKTGADEELSFRYLDENLDPIEVDDGTGTMIPADYFGLSSVQEAKNAKFEYNGIEIERATNKVTDLIAGVTLDLNKIDDKIIHISVSQDLSILKEGMQTFVDSYNSLMKLISEITKYDEEGGEHGSFQGDSRINGIRSDINRVLFGQNDEGKSLMDLTRVRMDLETGSAGAFAFDLTDKGVLKFDSTTFNQVLDQDPAAIERLFRGFTKIKQSEAVGSAIADSTSEVAINDVKINGVSIGAFTFEAGKTAIENAQKAMDAINAIKDQTGVTARLTANKQGLILSDSTGMGFNISGADSGLLGLSNGVYTGSNETKGGLFSAMKDKVDSINGFLGDTTMSLIKTELQNEVKNNTNSIQSVLNRLNAKYNVMAMQFSAYNSMISLYESSFSSIQMQIDQAAARK